MDVMMEKVKAFFGWVLTMVKGLMVKVLALPKRAMCWLHSKWCGC